MARKFIYIAGGIVVVLVVVALILPFVIDANRFRPQIESAASSTLNRKVSIGSIRLALLSGGVAIDDFSIADDPQFGAGAFLTAKSVSVAVKLMPLIMSRDLQVTGITIDQPEITLLRSPSGVWNYSTIGTTTTASSSTASSAPPSFSVQRIDVANGAVTVGKVGSNKRSEYSGVTFEATDVSFTSQFPFTLALQTPGSGTLKLTGKIGPVNQTNAEMTPLDASVEVHNFDLTTTGFMDPSSGIAGTVDFTGSLTSDGRQASSNGTLTANKLKLVPAGIPAGKAVKVDYTFVYQMQPQTGTLSKGDVQIGNAVAHLTGTVDNSGEAPSVKMKLVGDSMPAPDLETVLPALGVNLPSGASLKEGTLSASLSIDGSVNHLVTTGPVKLSNGKLAGFDLGAKMGVLSSFAGIPKGSDTVIQTLSSDVRVAPEGIQATNFDLVVPAIGAVTGNGTVAANQSLDFKMVAHLTSSSNPIGSIASLAGGGQKGNSGGIPFKIQGTSSNPTFIPDVAGIATGIAKSVTPQDVDNIGKQLGGLFGKKK